MKDNFTIQGRAKNLCYPTLNGQGIRQFCKLVSNWTSHPSHSNFFRVQDFCSNILEGWNNRVFDRTILPFRQLAIGNHDFQIFSEDHPFKKNIYETLFFRKFLPMPDL
jgi:hypothetical protein